MAVTGEPASLPRNSPSCHCRASSHNGSRTSARSARPKSVVRGRPSRRFQTPTGGCAGYQQVGLHDGKLAGHDGAILEYTCAPPNAQPRHGIWQTVVVGGQAYQVTLSTTANRFDESRAIFDEMVRSFRLAT